jgi:hypothetical protein
VLSPGVTGTSASPGVVNDRNTAGSRPKVMLPCGTRYPLGGPVVPEV